MTVLLHIEGLGVRYGGVRALEDASLSVRDGEIVGLIGPNGAGKTTLLGACSGFVAPSTGVVRFDGHDLVGLAPHRVAARGLVRTFQGVRAVEGLTVHENVLAGAHRRGRSGAFGALFGGPRARSEERLARAEADRVLVLVGLTDLADAHPSDLSTGHLRLLEIARTLASGPRLLLLDEPAAGLDHEETARLETVLRVLRDADVACVLVEHDVELVLRVSDRVTVLDHGRVIATGSPQDVRRNPAVIEAYLGPRPQEAHHA
ncbi:MAG: livG [Solirubrobacterales bacterium]|nr:livG [Solirubrobacterales bacterium]